MSFQNFSYVFVGLIFIGAVVPLLSRSWKWALGSLGCLYFGVFGLVASSWPIDLALVKLIAGWLACSILAVTQNNVPKPAHSVSQVNSELLFWALSLGLIVLLSIPAAMQLSEWLPVVPLVQAWAGFYLIGAGLLSLGFSNQNFRVSISLLLFLSGFEVIYAAVEASALVTGFLALINLTIALISAYLIQGRLLGEKSE